MADDAQISSDWLDNILMQAIDSRVSDIHFEPRENTFEVRFRIDGLLSIFQILDKNSQENILTRIKVLSGMDIAEKRLPQDGHYKLSYKHNLYNFRVSTLPSLFGESLVLRILTRENILTNLELLGFLPEQLEMIKKITTGSAGLILTTGPTGSGKTNLLYSLINSFKKEEKNIVTLEDPVEYQLEKVCQVQINESTGLTFARAMRSVLRQDPDVIMLGEIRDPETASMAIQASLTGIMVFCSFHTFDAPALISRFREFGLTNSVLAQSLKGIISTRLLRKICPNCRKSWEIKNWEKYDSGFRKIAEKKKPPIFLSQGQGCYQCSHRGYLGRTGIYEVVYFDEEIKESIIEQKSPSFLRDLIQKKKVKTLREVAWEKVLQGITTLEEVVRVLGQE